VPPSHRKSLPKADWGPTAGVGGVVPGPEVCSATDSLNVRGQSSVLSVTRFSHM
jgi:hypothetical protein